MDEVWDSHERECGCTSCVADRAWSSGLDVLDLCWKVSGHMLSMNPRHMGWHTWCCRQGLGELDH